MYESFLVSGLAHPRRFFFLFFFENKDTSKLYNAYKQFYPHLPDYLFTPFDAQKNRCGIRLQCTCNGCVSVYLIPNENSVFGQNKSIEHSSIPISFETGVWDVKDIWGNRWVTFYFLWLKRMNYKTTIQSSWLLWFGLSNKSLFWPFCFLISTPKFIQSANK